jgi:hypothetical protein
MHKRIACAEAFSLAVEQIANRHFQQVIGH